jgi:hypothetical protein
MFLRILSLALIASFLTPTAAFAEWASLDEDKGYYYDPATIDTQGQRVKVWGVVNYSSPLELGNATTQSKKILIEYDCLQNRLRTVAFTFTTKAMGQGDSIPGFPMLTGSPYAKWRPVQPETFEQALFNKVCRPAPEPSALSDGEEVVDESAPASAESKNKI